jgi:hypothetical protein
MRWWRSVFRCSCVVVAVVGSLAGCNDAVILSIASERPVPAAVDAMCVGIADASARGGQFGKLYALGDVQLPQTLRVDPGSADAALAWVRADRGGVATLVESARIDFGGDVAINLPRCQVGGGGAITVSDARGPANARLAASYGQGGARVVALAKDTMAVLDADGAVALEMAGMPLAIVAADLDGDCDDDVIVATDAAAPIVWKREGASFVVGEAVGTTPVAAVATADVDHDGDADVVLGSGGSLQLWLNNGAAQFTPAPGALSGAGRVSAVSTLAMGDVNGDGHADLVVGQAGPPLVAWLGTGGTFDPNDAVVPAIALDVERLTFADANGDYTPDLAVAVRNAPMHLLIERNGRLEEQTFPKLMTTAPIAHAIAIGGWDASCEPDLVIASDAGAPTFSGSETVFQPGDPAPPSTDVVMTDIDGDGDLDAVVATPDGVRWLAR